MKHNIADDGKDALGVNDVSGIAKANLNEPQVTGVQSAPGGSARPAPAVVYKKSFEAEEHRRS